MSSPPRHRLPVPLRPMGVADVLDGGFRLLRAAPAAVLVPGLLAAVLVTVAETGLRLALDPAAALVGSLSGGLAASLLLQLAGTVISTMGVAVVAAFVAGVLVVGLAGDRPSLRAVWPVVRGRLAVALLVGLVVGVVQAVALFFLVAPGVLVWGVWALAVPPVVVERAGPVTALRRSVQLQRPGFWRVLGLRLLAALTGVAFGYLFRTPFVLLSDVVTDSELATAGITAAGTLLAAAIVLPLRAGVDVMLYLDQRIRREAFDVTVALNTSPRGDTERAAAQPQVIA